MNAGAPTTQFGQVWLKVAQHVMLGRLVSVGAPCFSRGSDASASRKELHFGQSGFSPGFENPAAKAGGE